VLTLGSGDGPPSVRRHPSTVNGASRFLKKGPSATIDRGASVPPPGRNQGPGPSLPGPEAAIPCKVREPLSQSTDRTVPDGIGPQHLCRTHGRTLTCGSGFQRTGRTPSIDLRIRRLGVRVPPSAPGPTGPIAHQQRPLANGFANTGLSPAGIDRGKMFGALTRTRVLVGPGPWPLSD
jgi:hypothetical protein